MRVWTSLSLFLVTSRHLSSQIDSIESPNRCNLNSNIGLGTLSPPAGPRRLSGILKKKFCFNSCPILELVSASICVKKLCFSYVFRMTVSARTERVFRLSR